MMSIFLRIFAPRFPLGNRLQRYEDYRNYNEKNRMVKQRILQIIENKNLTRSIFFQKTGLKRGFLDSDKLEQAVSDRQIAMIIAAFPDIDTDWLITGKGKMTRESTPEAPSDGTLTVLLERIEDLARDVGRLQAENEELKNKLARAETRTAASAKAAAG